MICGERTEIILKLDSELVSGPSPTTFLGESTELFAINEPPIVYADKAPIIIIMQWKSIRIVLGESTEYSVIGRSPQSIVTVNKASKYYSKATCNLPWAKRTKNVT